MRRLVALLACLPALARADAHVVRLGSIVPDGSGFAREVHALGMEAEGGDESRTLKVKYYLGGIAGDELEMLDRVKRGQLDGVISGGMLCEKLAPSLRVSRIPGLIQQWDEAEAVLTRLKPTLDKEALEHGFVNVGEVVVGPSILFTRAPAASLADLQQAKLWIWDTDEMLKLILPVLGMPLVPLPIHQAANAYDTHKVDGFITPAAAALGFQWSAQAKYFTDLRMGFVVGCVVVATRAFDALPLVAQKSLRNAAAHSQSHYQSVAMSQEQELLGGLFRRQGVQPVTVSPDFRANFHQAAQLARDKVAGKLVSPELIQKVLGWLADYRSEHHASR
jgi:TRAP-type C4-dicarboxylate transport system substrate-binding protein